VVEARNPCKVESRGFEPPSSPAPENSVRRACLSTGCSGQLLRSNAVDRLPSASETIFQAGLLTLFLRAGGTQVVRRGSAKTPFYTSVSIPTRAPPLFLFFLAHINPPVTDGDGSMMITALLIGLFVFGLVWLGERLLDHCSRSG